LLQGCATPLLGLLSYQAGKLYTDSPLRISANSLVGGEAVYRFATSLPRLPVFTRLSLLLLLGCCVLPLFFRCWTRRRHALQLMSDKELRPILIDGFFLFFFPYFGCVFSVFLGGGGGFFFLLPLVGFGVSFFTDAATPSPLPSKVGAITCWSLNWRRSSVAKGENSSLILLPSFLWL